MSLALFQLYSSDCIESPILTPLTEFILAMTVQLVIPSHLWWRGNLIVYSVFQDENFN